MAVFPSRSINTVTQRGDCDDGISSGVNIAGIAWRLLCIRLQPFTNCSKRATALGVLDVCASAACNRGRLKTFVGEGEPAPFPLMLKGCVTGDLTFFDRAGPNCYRGGGSGNQTWLTCLKPCQIGGYLSITAEIAKQSMNFVNSKQDLTSLFGSSADSTR